MNILKKMFDHEYKELKRIDKLADEVLAMEPVYNRNRVNDCNYIRVTEL